MQVSLVARRFLRRSTTLSFVLEVSIEVPDNLLLQQQPAELYQEFNTIEYIQQQAKPVQPPAYIFVVDTSVAEDELRACVASLSHALTTLPEYAQVSASHIGLHTRRMLVQFR